MGANTLGTILCPACGAKSRTKNQDEKHFRRHHTKKDGKGGTA